MKKSADSPPSGKQKAKKRLRPPKSRKDLLLEIDDLRLRLGEAEETLQAIRSGAVDAIVVSGPGGESVYTLKSAETPYRFLVESMNEGAANVSAEGLVLYCNGRIAQALGLPLQSIIGRHLRDFVVPEGRRACDALVKKGLRRSAFAELALITNHGPLPVHCSFRPLRQDRAASVAVVITDISGRIKAEQSLRRMNEELERRVKVRTLELEEANTRLRSYARHLVEREEDIKKKLAADLHDVLGQSLTFLNINFALLKEVLPAELRKKHRARFNEVSGFIEDAGRAVRRFMSDLRPPILDAYGLAAALRWQCDLFSKSTGIKVDLRSVDRSLIAPPESRQALFRIAQEALANVTKHAMASRVTIGLGIVKGRIRLSISDNGRGFEPPQGPVRKAEGGWGMTIMRERAQSIDGSFRLHSTPGKGSRIVVEAPAGA